MEMWEYRLAQKARARRTRKNLVKSKAKMYYIAKWLFVSHNSRETMEDVYNKRKHMVRILYRNRKKCSCWLCGNPRKYFLDLTKQEKRSNIDYKQQLEDLYMTDDVCLS